MSGRCRSPVCVRWLQRNAAHCASPRCCTPCCSWIDSLEARATRHLAQMKEPDRSAHMRIMVRLAFCFAEPHQAAAISASRWQSHTRLDVSQKVLSVGDGLLLFLLGGLLLCLLRFLSHRALRGPKIEVQCKSSIDVQTIAYTTIAKLILCASNKVNGAHPCERANSLS